MPPKKAAAVDPTVQAWARLYKNAQETLFVTAPLALLVSIGIAYNVLPSPFNVMAALLLLGGAAYVVVPRVVATDEPSARDIKEADDNAAQLQIYLAELEARDEAKKAAKERKQRNKQLDRLRREEKERKARAAKAEQDAARRRKAAAASGVADEKDEDTILGQYAKRAMGGGGSRGASARGGDIDEDLGIGEEELAQFVSGSRGRK